MLIFQGWSVYGWTRDDFPLIFIVKDRLLYWSTTPLPNTYLRLWRKRSVCVRVPLAYSTFQAPSPAFCERTSDSVLPINENHRVSQVGRDLQGWSSPTPGLHLSCVAHYLVPGKIRDVPRIRNHACSCCQLWWWENTSRKSVIGKFDTFVKAILNLFFPFPSYKLKFSKLLPVLLELKTEHHFWKLGWGFCFSGRSLVGINFLPCVLYHTIYGLGHFFIFRDEVWWLHCWCFVNPDDRLLRFPSRVSLLFRNFKWLTVLHSLCKVMVKMRQSCCRICQKVCLSLVLFYKK